MKAYELFNLITTEWCGIENVLFIQVCGRFKTTIKKNVKFHLHDYKSLQCRNRLTCDQDSMHSN